MNILVFIKMFMICDISSIRWYGEYVEHSEETAFFRAFDAKSFGVAIRNARQECGLTQLELGAMIKASRHTIVRLEQGENVALETAMAAAKALERDIALIPRFSRLDVKR